MTQHDSSDLLLRAAGCKRGVRLKEVRDLCHFKVSVVKIDQKDGHILFSSSH